MKHLYQFMEVNVIALAIFGSLLIVKLIVVKKVITMCMNACNDSKMEKSLRFGWKTINIYRRSRRMVQTSPWNAQVWRIRIGSVLMFCWRT